MNVLIEGSGWFVYTMSGLASADPKFIAAYTSSRKEEQPATIMGEKDFRKLFAYMEFSGVARISRKGWRTVNHPILGTLQWKIGTNFRNCKDYMFVKLNGKEVISLWRTTGWSEIDYHQVAAAISDAPIEGYTTLRERVGRVFVHAEAVLTK